MSRPRPRKLTNHGSYTHYKAGGRAGAGLGYIAVLVLLVAPAVIFSRPEAPKAQAKAGTDDVQIASVLTREDEPTVAPDGIVKSEAPDASLNSGSSPSVEMAPRTVTAPPVLRAVTPSASEKSLNSEASKPAVKAPKQTPASTPSTAKPHLAATTTKSSTAKSSNAVAAQASPTKHKVAKHKATAAESEAKGAGQVASRNDDPPPIRRPF